MKFLQCVIILLVSFQSGIAQEEKQEKKEKKKPSRAEVIADLTSKPLIIIKLKRGDTDIVLNIDPTATDVYFDILLEDEKPPVRKVKSKEEIKKEEDFEKKLKEMMKKIEKAKEKKTVSPGIKPEVLDYIYKAQKLYYAKNYKGALKEVQKSLEISKTALGYALEGSILFALGERDLAIGSWKSALTLDPTMTEVDAILKMYQP